MDFSSTTEPSALRSPLSAVDALSSMVSPSFHCELLRCVRLPELLRSLTERTKLLAPDDTSASAAPKSDLWPTSPLSARPPVQIEGHCERVLYGSEVTEALNGVGAVKRDDASSLCAISRLGRDRILVLAHVRC